MALSLASVPNAPTVNSRMLFRSGIPLVPTGLTAPLATSRLTTARFLMEVAKCAPVVHLLTRRITAALVKPVHLAPQDTCAKIVAWTHLANAYLVVSVNSAMPPEPAKRVLLVNLVRRKGKASAVCARKVRSETSQTFAVHAMPGDSAPSLV